MKGAITVACTLISAFTFSQSAEEILNKYFASVSGGDINNWRSFNSVYIESRGFFNSDGQHFSLKGMPLTYQKVYRQWPDKLKIEHYKDSSFTELSGYTLWRGDKHRLVHWFDLGEQIENEIHEVKWDFNPLVLYRLYQEKKAVKLLGRERFASDTTDCFIVEIKGKTESITLAINSTSYLLEYMRPGARIDQFNFTRICDYHTFGALKVSFQTYSVSGGSITFFEQITHMEFNRPINDGIFALP